MNSGQKITKPTDPTKTGAAFVNWYKEKPLTNVFDFNTTITADMTLYAKWDDGSPVITSFVIPSNGKAGITEDIAADIDETGLTITLVLNVPSTTDKTPLANLTPTITSPSSMVEGALPTDYSQNKETDLTIKHANGKTKTYKLKVIFASFYVKLGDVGTGFNKADIASYGIELYTPKYKELKPNDSWYTNDNDRLEIDVATSSSLPYGIGTYVKSSDDAHIVVYGKSASGDTVVALYAQSKTSATGKGTTLSINAIPDGQGLVIANVDQSVFTCDNWVSVFGGDRSKTRVINLELSRSGNSDFSVLHQTENNDCGKSDYYLIKLSPLTENGKTINRASTIRAYIASFTYPDKVSAVVPLNMRSYWVAKPTLVFSL